MTEMERNRVVELQHQGYGYKKISTLTGLPLNTVKSFCTRHPVRYEDIAEQQGLCRNCLKQLEQTPHRRKRYFCSDACRMAWWNAHPERLITSWCARTAARSLRATETIVVLSAPACAIHSIVERRLANERI